MPEHYYARPAPRTETVQQLEGGYGHHHPDYQEDAATALGGQYGARNPVNKERRTDANVTKIDAISRGGQ